MIVLPHNTVLVFLVLCACFGEARGQSTDSLTVHFAFNQSTLPAEDRNVLDHWFQRCSTRLMAVQLIGYCDSVGGNKYNDSLSLRRVDSVRSYLRSKGIADTLFTVLRAVGKRNPLNDNGDEEKRSQNRRVTIVGRMKSAAPALDEILKEGAGAVGKSVSLNILFYASMHRPMPVSMPVLVRVLDAMREHPGLRIEIAGNVCCGGGEDGIDIESHKQDLSVARAKYIYDYLVRLGIDSSRLSYQGFAGRRKIYPQELDEHQRSMNRRVEVKILGW